MPDLQLKKMIKELKETGFNMQPGTNPGVIKPCPSSSIPNQSSNLNPQKVLDTILNNTNMQDAVKETLTRVSQIEIYKQLENLI